MLTFCDLFVEKVSESGHAPAHSAEALTKKDAPLHAGHLKSMLADASDNENSASKQKPRVGR
jgi:hypothetical protein